jgi:hypothetical protein
MLANLSMAKITISGEKLTATTILQVLYGLSLLTAVLPFGAVNPLPIAAATGFACLVALSSALILGPPLKTRWLFAIASVLTGVTMLWIELQTVPAIGHGLGNPLWNDLKIAALPQAGSISIQPADSIAGLSFLALPLLTFLTGLTIIRSDADARRFMTLLAVIGGICAVYGLCQFLLFPTTNLFFTKTAYLDSLTATFVNRNTAGTFLGLACLVLTRYVWSLSREFSFSDMLQDLLSNRPVQTAGLTLFMVISMLLGCTLMALFLTKSRGAIGSTVIASLFLVCFLVMQPSKQSPGLQPAPSRKRAFLKASMACGFILLILVAFGGRALFRAEAQGTGDARYCVLPGIIELAKGEPLLGYGFASFRYAFPPYRDPKCGVIFVWERAHNFFLEGMIGLGAMFIVVVVVAISALLIALLIGVRDRRRMRSYSALGLASMVLVGLHALVDFSLQIPGMAAYFAAIMATTATISLGRSTEGKGKRGM